MQWAAQSLYLSLLTMLKQVKPQITTAKPAVYRMRWVGKQTIIVVRTTELGFAGNRGSWPEHSRVGCAQIAKKRTARAFLYPHDNGQYKSIASQIMAMPDACWETITGFGEHDCRPMTLCLVCSTSNSHHWVARISSDNQQCREGRMGWGSRYSRGQLVNCFYMQMLTARVISKV